MSFKMRSTYFAAALSAVLTVAAVASAKYKAQDPKILVHAKGPAGMAIEGKSSKLMIDEDDKNVTFKTFLNTIDTDNSMRNKHMQERFEGDKFPEIKLIVEKSKIEKSGTIPGTLTFHGQAKPVKVKYDVKGKHVHASFDFNITNHGVDKEKVCAMGVCAKTDVNVEVDFDVKE